MATKRMNVLVYSGNGSLQGSVQHCLYTLRRLLSPTYAVIPVTGDVIIKEPWTASCALLVFPGGADMGYCRTLNGEGNRRISQYVNRGGSYLGFCAGGYYGTARCEFEVDDKKMAVVGDRELGFFPGICRGLAFAGFVYHSEAGARAADLRIEKGAFESVPEGMEDTFKSYYNGGGLFVDAKKLESRGVQTLASYTEDVHVDGGDGKAAIVYRKVGDGHVVLTGPHPEFAPNNLSRHTEIPSYGPEVIDKVTATDSTRITFMRLMLQKLGLKVNEEEQAVPPLSAMHLSAHSNADVASLLKTWSEVFTVVEEQEYIKGENDLFLVKREGDGLGVQGLRKAIDDIEAAGSAVKEAILGEEEAQKEQKRKDENTAMIQEAVNYTNTTAPDQILDYNKVLKQIVPHLASPPAPSQTPRFDHGLYYTSLTQYHANISTSNPTFGRTFLYGEVVTSTNTLLDKNPTLLKTLPNGFTLLASTQVSGRGRGSNVWIAPPGSLLFSTILHHPFSMAQSAPIIFIQYLAALAIVRGVKSYAPGYEKIPVKLKWPNDVYAEMPGTSKNEVVKIGGILVNSSYSGTNLSVVTGIGLNLANAAPTTSLNLLAASQSLEPFQHEQLLANILAHFEDLYRHLCAHGFSQQLEEEYYSYWLHTDQIVTLETHGGIRARIKGITRDWGLLLAEELGYEDRGTGKVVQLQSDSNSFDFFKGLVRRKV